MVINFIGFVGLAAVLLMGFTLGYWWRGRKKQS